MIGFGIGIVVGAAATWAFYRFHVIARYKSALLIAKNDVRRLGGSVEHFHL